MNLGNTRLTSYAELHEEGDLLSAYNIAQSLPVQAFPRLTFHVPSLESFLENLHSALCHHAKNHTQPALEYAANVSRLSLILCPAELDTRADFLEARAIGLDALFRDSEYGSSRDPGMLMEAVILRRRLLALANSHDEQHKQRLILASLLLRFWKRDGEKDLVLLREEMSLRRKILQTERGLGSNTATSCDSLADTLYSLYKSAGDAKLIDEALELNREALRLRPEGHPARAHSCGNRAI
jgi:hypothetical protein